MLNPTLARCIAKSVDFCVVIMLSVLLPSPIGPLFGLGYALFHDAWQGQGLGKRIFRFRAVRASNHQPCNVLESLLRNLPFSVFVLFGIIPLWGWIIALTVGPALGILELYFMHAQRRGRRLGDVLARTRVITLP